MRIPSSFRSTFSAGFLGVFFAAALALAPQPASAQHGGGRAAGGGHFGGGAAHASSAPHAAGPPASYRPSAPRSPAAAPFVRPNPHVITVPPQSFIARRPSQFGAPVVGNHILMPPVVPGTGASSNVHPTVGYPSVPPASWHVTNVTGPTMRFEGQGNEIWQSPAGQALGQVHRSPIGGPIGRPIRPPIFGPGFGFRGGFPIYGGPFFGGGFGLGLGYGWGPTCGPYWGWGFGCNGLAYYDYGYGNDYVGPPVSNWPSSDYGSQPETPPSTETGPFLYESGTPEQAQANIRAESFVTVLYLKDGSVYALDNYWVEGGKLHYTSGFGGENTVDIDQIDVQKTVDVNASRGVNFTLKPKQSGDAQSSAEPNAPAGAPEPEPPAPPQAAAPPSVPNTAAPAAPNSPSTPQSPPAANPQP
jgi:hypothetical protein